MSYYKNNELNRAALFGGASSSNKQRASTATRSTPTRNSLNSNAATGTLSCNSSISSRSTTSSLSTTSGRTGRCTGMSSTRETPSLFRPLKGKAKVTKMKEAEEYRLKAKKAMQHGLFSRPDPIIAGTYYRRAAEAYKLCGENRLERLHRIACADCQRGQECYPSAAREYTRAAELAVVSEESLVRRRNEVFQLNKNAADAWMAANEIGKAGLSYVDAACGLLIGEENEEQYENFNLQIMDRKALATFEEAVEMHVPDPLNRFASFRKTGKSMYNNEETTSKPASSVKKNVLLQEFLVKSPFAHETLQKVTRKLLYYAENSTALYTAGATSKLLEVQNASISLHRAYLTETILQLSLKDVVGADKNFLETHLQKNSYLASRACKLAEDLIRAFKTFSQDDLDRAKLENRSALHNLDPTLSLLVMNFRLTSGVSRNLKNPSISKAINNSTTTTENVPTDHSEEPLNPMMPDEFDGDKLKKSLDDNFSEIDKIMENIGLDEVDENENEEEEEDDEIDLR